MSLRDLIHPETCVGCRRPTHCGFCRECLSQVRRLSPGCGRCDAPGVVGARGCQECREAEFDRAVQAFEFDDLIRSAVHRLKYRGALGLARSLARAVAEIAAPRLRCPSGPLAITWVPSSPSSIAYKGFDHARLLAEALAEVRGQPCSELLSKEIDTPRQVKLPPSQRRRMLRGAMRPRIPAADVVIVVDDVLTTGTSVSEAARALRSGGAGWVGSLCVARSYDRS